MIRGWLTRASSLAATLLLLLAALVLAPAPVSAQTGPGESPAPGADDRPRLAVEELTGTLRPDGTFRLVATVSNPTAEVLDELSVVATFQRRTTTRLDYQRAVDVGDRRRSTAARLTAELDPVAAGAGVPVEFSSSVADLGLSAERLAGVYPLRLELQRDGAPLDEVRTSVVALPELVGEPVRTALLVPLDSPVGLLPDGTVDGDPLAGGLQVAGRLPALADVLAAAPEMAFTVATSALVLEEVERAAEGYTAVDRAGTVEVPPGSPPARRAARLLDDVRTVLARPEIEQVALPYASADLVALARNDQQEAARQAIVSRVLSAERVTDDRPAPGVLWPPDGLDPATLEQAVAAGIDTVVLDPANLDTGAPNAAALSPSPVRRLDADGERVTALVADPWLSGVLAAGQPAIAPGAADAPPDATPAVAAQRILAETAALYFERPFAPETRGLLLAPPQLWNPAPETLEALLQGLAAAPWLRPVTVPQLAAELAPDAERGTLVYPSAAAERELDAGYVEALGEAAGAVAQLRNVLAADETTPARADRLLRAAMSLHYRGGRERIGRALVEAVIQTAGTVFGSLEVIPGPQVTLTNRSGQVPVTVRSTAQVPVRVEVRVQSLRFEFDDQGISEPIVLGPGQERLVVFTAEALTVGATTPITVRVTDVGGAQVLATGQVVVRSTAYSVTALAITAGAGLFLAVWWVRDARRRHRRSPEPATRRSAARVG